MLGKDNGSCDAAPHTKTTNMHSRQSSIQHEESTYQYIMNMARIVWHTKATRNHTTEQPKG